MLRINVNAGDNCAVSLISLLYGWLAGVPGSCVIKHERAGVSEAPYLSKVDMLEVLKADGIEPPRLYAMGFAHNNCGGFCCRAGQGHFAKLLEALPDRYARAEQEENSMRELLGKDIAFMKKTTNGVTKPYTLRQLRLDVEAHKEIDLFDIGGCGCFVDSD